MPRISPAERLKERVQAGQAAYAAGKLAEAGTEWSAALRSARRLQAPETLQIALYNNLAGLYMNLGQHRRAKRTYQAALATAERIHGPESHTAAVILNNLAELERAGGKTEAAEPLFRRALAILERAENGNRQQLGSVLANTAECLREIGKLADAAALNGRALSILEIGRARSTRPHRRGGQ